MNVRKRLNQFKYKSIEIEAIQEELIYLERSLSPCVTPRIIELKRMLDTLIEDKLMLANIIDNIADPVARSIFRFRYVVGCSWDVVAYKCGKMSERNAHYIHDRTIPEVERLYAERSSSK